MIAGYADGERPLTPRMRAVLRSAAAGANVDESAGELRISRSTVKTIRAAACHRLGTKSVTQAVAKAYRDGLL